MSVRPITRTPPGCQIDALTHSGPPSATNLLQLCNKGLRRILVFFRFVNQRVGKDAARANVDQPPLALAGHRVSVLLPQETNALGIFEGGNVSGEPVELPHI